MARYRSGARRHGTTGHALDHGIRPNPLCHPTSARLNLLIRLYQHHDAIAAVKSKQRLLTLAGEVLKASGLSLPSVALTRRDGDQHRFSQIGRDTYTGVRAHWNDKVGSKRQTAVVGKGEKFKNPRATYASETDALEGAKSERHRTPRGKAEFGLTIAHGRADLISETPVTLRGWKPQINDIDWLVTEIEDSLNDSGHGGRIKCRYLDMKSV